MKFRLCWQWRSEVGVSVSLFLTELDKRNLLGLVILLIFMTFTFASQSFCQSSLLCFMLALL